jgi:hypothetical protein
VKIVDLVLVEELGISLHAYNYMSDPARLEMIPRRRSMLVADIQAGSIGWVLPNHIQGWF